MKNTIKIIAGAIVGYLLLDMVGAMLWIISGQTTGEGYFIGKVTQLVLRVIL